MWRCLFLVSLCLATPCLAGPWPREKGTAFVATGMTTEPAGSFYVEYGLGNDWTVGADAYGTWTYTGHAAAFASKSFTMPHGLRLGLETAAIMRSTGIKPLDPLGQTWGLALVGPNLRLGASLGRGLDILSGGWTTAAASLIVGDPYSQKIDLTLGTSPTQRTKVYGQLQGARTSGGQVWRAELAAGVRLNESHEFMLNYNFPLGKGASRVGMTLWQTFQQ